MQIPHIFQGEEMEIFGLHCQFMQCLYLPQCCSLFKGLCSSVLPTKKRNAG